MTFTDHNGLPVHIAIVPHFKKGDQPPTGYNEWHEWAEVQHKAGLRQSYCPMCGKWLFPQEDCGHAKNQRMNDRQVRQANREAQGLADAMREAQLKAELKAIKRRRT